MNNDLISRNDLEKFKILPFDKASCDDTEINAAYQNGWNDAIDRIIDNAPTVETEITNDDLQAAMTESYRLGYELAETKFKRPQGEWIIHNDYHENCRYGCNQCGNLTNIQGNFCPNCGVKMNL